MMPSFFLHRIRGFSMAEIMVAVFIVGLIIGPLVLLLNQSTQKTNVSMYLFLAMHYADEIAQQLQRMAPHFDQILAEAKDPTSQTTPTLRDLLMDGNFLNEVKKLDNNFTLAFFQFGAKKLQACLMLSPMDGHFKTRTLDVYPLVSQTSSILGQKNFWKVNIILEWKEIQNGPTQSALFPIILGNP